MTANKPMTLGISDAVQLAAREQNGGRSDIAEKIYKQVLQADPNNGDALHLLGLMEIDNTRYQNAESLLKRAVQHYPEVAGYQISHCLALALIGRENDALGKLGALLAKEPGDERARQVLGRVLRCGPEMTTMLRPSPPREPVLSSPAPAPDQTLIVGMAGGYSPDQLMPFVASLRRHYQGPVHLFTDGADDVTELFDQHAIAWTHVASPPLDFATFRWKLAAEFLDGVPDDTWVYLVDVGDVVFQGDPFAFSVDGEWAAFLEDTSMTIGACPWNREWMLVNFGHAMLATLTDRTISCCGTIAGRCAKLREYLAQFCVLAGTVPIAPKIGLDQAIHNILIYHGMVPGGSLISNGWPVATVQHMPEDSIGVTSDGTITLADGRIPAVVHQYNRRANMISAVMERYRRPDSAG
jgi:hypothetical protein